MTPVVLLVGQLENVISSAATDLNDRPVRWLGAHSREQVAEQLEAEPAIAAAIIGGTLPDQVRGDIVAGKVPVDGPSISRIKLRFSAD